MIDECIAGRVGWKDRISGGSGRAEESRPELELDLLDRRAS